MRSSKYLMMAFLAGAVFAGFACTDNAATDASRDGGAALDATKAGADKALDATKKASGETADAVKDIARKTADKANEVAERSKEVALAAGAAMTDGWITTKVKAKFADEIMLEGSNISVDTQEHVVTLKGTVPSRRAKTRAAEIASGTESVTRVVDQLVVKP